MAFRFVAILAFATVAMAGNLAVEHQYPSYVQAYAHAPAHVVKTYAAAPVLKHVEYESPAKYDFSYGVHDSHSGDIKNQVESREGGNVHGSYSVVDPDGFKRTVDYTADDVNGFNAVVRREPLAHVVHSVAPVTKVVAAPAHHYEHAPAHHYEHSSAHHYEHAPATYTAQYAPVAKYVAAPVHYAPATYTKVHAPSTYTKVVAPTTYAKVVAPAYSHEYHH